MYIWIKKSPLHSLRRILPYFVATIVATSNSACHPSIRYPPGGYAYPLQVAARDTNYYYYLIKSKISRRDSMDYAFAYLTFQAFDEPNLSLKPVHEDIFRLTYSEALHRSPIIITLTQNLITVKSGKPSEELINMPDTNRLTPLERRLVLLLDRNFPIDEKRPHRSEGKQHYLDSMGRVYPQLYNPAYYASLWDKEFAYTKPLYTYTSKAITISQPEFFHLVNCFDSAGYWHLPPELPCIDVPNDGYGFTLEANTSLQYNMVSSGSCGDTSIIPFARACQELVRYAKMDSVIHLYSDHKVDSVRPPLVIQEVHLEDLQEKPVKKKHKKK
jgi:hypothetical protein